MTSRWNDELTCKYVDLYKEHECLWNMTGTLYKRKDARQSALEEILRKMGMENFTTEDAKQKIESLKATYQQESHKIDKSFSFWSRPGRCVQTINEVVYINDRSDEKWCFEERNL
jgi:hypothetical protein